MIARAISAPDRTFSSQQMPIRPIEGLQPRDLPDEVDALLIGGYRYAFSLTHDAAEAEDLVQDACLAMLSSGAPWDRAYFYATIRNRFIDRYRRNRRVLFVALEQEQEQISDLNWDSPDVLRDGRLHRALGTLNPAERETLFLAVVEGYTAEEIATLTARPRGTILSLLFRTKKKLRELLGLT
ncbi:MAG: hypothetical protein DMF59_17890 [Acidobacteria bacterium]|nr:MAG: hypothetical protein DMF59_17890 [Acidobacteriota bacterium]